jgi:hypothetical protein
MTQTPPELPDVQRVLMDRARRMAERDLVPQERPLLPRVVALGLALLVVVIVLFAFDRFLASVQRFLAIPISDPSPGRTEPQPAYVVPIEPGGVEAAMPATPPAVGSPPPDPVAGD